MLSLMIPYVRSRSSVNPVVNPTGTEGTLGFNPASAFAAGGGVATAAARNLQSTRQLSPAQVDVLNNYDEEAAIIDRPHRWTDDGMAPTRFDEQVPDGALLDAVEAQLEDDPQLDDEIASELATAHVGEDLPFDPDEARAFDAAVNAGETDAVYVTGFEETSQPPPAAQRYDDVSEDPLSVSGSYDPYGTESVHAAPAFDSTAAEI